MTINLQKLGSKFEKYRVQLKETAEDVATSTGIHANRICAIESGQVEPTGDEVLILSDHYLNRPGF